MGEIRRDWTTASGAGCAAFEGENAGTLLAGIIIEFFIIGLIFGFTLSFVIIGNLGGAEKGRKEGFLLLRLRGGGGEGDGRCKGDRIKLGGMDAFQLGGALLGEFAGGDALAPEVKSPPAPAP